MCVGKSVEEHFLQRKKKVIDLIKSFNLQYEEIGIFGSYARGDYKSTSDIDFCIVTQERPESFISGALREEAELLKADIVFVSPEFFNTSTSNFAKHLRKDYRRVL